SGRARSKHRKSDREHHKREQEKKLLTVDDLADGRADRGADCARRSDDEGARPFHGSRAPMSQEVGERVYGDRERAGPNRDMGILDADDVKEQRHGENRTAAAYEAKRESDRGAGEDRENDLYRDQRGAACDAVIGWNGPSRCCSTGNLSAKGGEGASTGLRV